MKPLCFILMPFGLKTDGNKKEINFDTVYNSFIKPAVVEAGLEPVRADEEKSGGFIHKPMYERLMFCDFAVADLSFANANVFYELGIRHALKPYTTVNIYETSTRLPFDTAPLRTFHYEFIDGAVKDLDNKIKDLAQAIKLNLNAEKSQKDSPIAQLVEGYVFPELNYLKKDADAFATWVASTNTAKEDLFKIVAEWKKLSKLKPADDTGKTKLAEEQEALVQGIRKIETDNSVSLNYNFDLLYSILEAYKSVGAFKEITIMLEKGINSFFKENIYIKQQLGLAYNKIKEREASERILTSVIDKYGADPETSGLLGAVYKGLMDDNKDDEFMAQEYRNQAVDAYVQGFEADPRDYYPGVNALTLMYFGDEADERFNKFLPLVTYAAERQVSVKPKDYWGQATALELATLGMDKDKSKKCLAAALACQPDAWMKETTGKNLRKIYEKALITIADKADLDWLLDIVNRLGPLPDPVAGGVEQ